MMTVGLFIGCLVVAWAVVKAAVMLGNWLNGRIERRIGQEWEFTRKEKSNERLNGEN